MTFPEFFSTFGETFTFAGLALFIIWWLIQQQAKADEKVERAKAQVDDIAKAFTEALADRDRRFVEAMDRRDERFSSALGNLTTRFTDEINKHREELTALRISLAQKLANEAPR